MTRDLAQGVEPDQPSGAKQQASVTTVRKAIVIGALVALLAGGVSSLATAQLTSQAGEIDRLNAEIAAQAERASAAEAQVEANEERASAAESQVEDLKAENADLEEQLSQLLNPPTGPSPTAVLTVNWVRTIRPGAEETIVCVTIENTPDSDASLFYSESGFAASNGENSVYPPVINPYFLSVPLMSGDLKPGESRRGELPYVVPPQAQPLTRLVWKTGFEETPEIVVDLPPPGVYDNADLC